MDCRGALFKSFWQCPGEVTEIDMTQENYQKYLDTAIQLAKKAGQIQLENRDQDVRIDFKGDINLVTEIDKKCEELIIEGLESSFPEHDILAEEGSGSRKDSHYKWIIDPLDGTTNFAHGYPLFCVSIALEYQEEIVVGVVYDPNLDELFTAIKGEGSFLNDKKIQVSQIKELNRALVSTGFAYNLRETTKNNIKEFGTMLHQAQAVRRDGVAAIDLCYVACGRYDAFWELNLFPWDVAAGGLILTEAGGVVTNYKNEIFSVYEKEIAASNGKIHNEILKWLE